MPPGRVLISLRVQEFLQLVYNRVVIYSFDSIGQRTGDIMSVMDLPFKRVQ